MTDPAPTDDALVDEVAEALLPFLKDVAYGVRATDAARAVLATPALAARLATTGTTDEAAVEDDELFLWPPHWTTDDVLRDQHARYHDEPGNLFGRDECDWEGCQFWDAAEHLAEHRLLNPPHRAALASSAPRTEPTDGEVMQVLAVHRCVRLSRGMDYCEHEGPRVHWPCPTVRAVLAVQKPQPVVRAFPADDPARPAMDDDYGQGAGE